MGDLAEDTAVAGEDGRYSAELSSDWAIWGPNGGYVAAVALRAAGAASAQPRPASASVHFLGVADFAPVDLEVTTLRATKRAESLRVSMTQGGAPIVEALVWAVADDLPGLEYRDPGMPEVPPPEELAAMEELMAPEERSAFVFWDNLENRPTNWIPREEWPHRVGGAHEVRSWLRFRPTPRFDDPWIEAGRLAVVIDTFSWPAAMQGEPGAGGPTYMAPSLDLDIRFHALPAPAWVLVDAAAPVAADGLVGSTSRAWDADGRLLASGGGQLLCRPVPPT